MEKYMIKEVAEKDILKALELVNRVFAEFVAIDYSEQGKVAFESYLENKLQEVTTSLKSGDKKLWAYYKEDEILGVIAAQSTSHISLMFVDKQYHRQGIARKLLNIAIDWFKKNEGVSCITVNSSPYAVKAYEHLGFIKKEDQQEKDGIIYVPMARTL
jgi:GNAT superfamily N-acetyltransferase